MNVLLIGSGGREHALAWKLSQSNSLSELFLASNNSAADEFATIVHLNVDDFADVVDFCSEKSIGLVVVGPEGPLVAGITDYLRDAGIRVFGPSKAAAQLEGSKGFTKDFCTEFSIPTATYGRFHDAASAKLYINSVGAPIVVKADGIASGKGVVVAMTVGEAFDAVDACFAGAFGTAGAEIVIEEFLEGEEVSFFCICDGKTAVRLASAQDHKRVGEGDTGPNTGGMGAYSPTGAMTSALEARVMSEIIEPTMLGMIERGAPFVGVLFAGLMLTEQGPKLIEYNTRFGDPETQVLMMRLEDDLLGLLNAAVDGKLEKVSIKLRNEVALTVVYAANGYPGTPQTGTVINNVGSAALHSGIRIFHAATRSVGHELFANGGRVLNVTAIGKTTAEAYQKAYDALDEIDWDGGFFRTDIGWREINRALLAPQQV
jgi:phosphoribosylamine---glycine ligase